MSEWVKRSGWWRREYAPDFVGEAAVGGHGQVHPWQCADYSLASRPVNGAEGYAPTLAEAQARCDEAALAYLVVALARKAAAWGREVDAGLVRSYRAAWWWAELWSRLAVRARAPARAYTKYQRACGREEKMRLAIVRGWP